MLMIRKSNEEWKIEREEFKRRFNHSFYDPWFDAHRQKIAELEDIAWKAYLQGRKAPRTRKAGNEFKDPEYELSIEWYEARQKILEAQKIHEDPKGHSRVLLISSSDRNDHT